MGQQVRPFHTTEATRRKGSKTSETFYNDKSPRDTIWPHMRHVESVLEERMYLIDEFCNGIDLRNTCQSTKIGELPVHQDPKVTERESTSDK